MRSQPSIHAIFCMDAKVPRISRGSRYTSHCPGRLRRFILPQANFTERTSPAPTNLTVPIFVSELVHGLSVQASFFFIDFNCPAAVVIEAASALPVAAGFHPSHCRSSKYEDSRKQLSIIAFPKFPNVQQMCKFEPFSSLYVYPIFPCFCF